MLAQALRSGAGLGQQLLPQLGALSALARAVSSSAATGAAAAAAAPASKPVVEKEFLVYRWNPDSAEAPKYDSYKVDINA